MAVKYWITGHKSGLGHFLLRNLNSSIAFDPRVKGSIEKSAKCGTNYTYKLWF